MFAFRLCLQLGYPHPDYLLPHLTSRQFSEWVAAFRLMPFGQDHTDLLIAQLTALTANANKGKSGKTFQPKDFLPLAKKEMSAEQVKATLRGILDGYRSQPGRGSEGSNPAV